METIIIPPQEGMTMIHGKQEAQQLPCNFQIQASTKLRMFMSTVPTRFFWLDTQGFPPSKA